MTPIVPNDLRVTDANKLLTVMGWAEFIQALIFSEETRLYSAELQLERSY